MKVDLHNHTSLCNHAVGEMHEYVEKAILAGTKYFGFSDHAPMDFDPKYRMSFDDISAYEQKVLALKEKYKKDIEIFLAYEVDYLQGHMDARIFEADVDYLIGSVHFIGEWGFDNPEFIGRYEHEDIDAIWQKYFDAIESMAKSGSFDIVGHFDLIKVFKFMPKKDINLIAKNALLAIKKADMVLELNGAGFRKPIAESYPSMPLLREAFRLGIPITFGSDAHAPEQVGMFSKELVEIAKDIGYKECAIFRKRKREFISF